MSAAEQAQGCRDSAGGDGDWPSFTNMLGSPQPRYCSVDDTNEGGGGSLSKGTGPQGVHLIILKRQGRNFVADGTYE